MLKNLLNMCSLTDMCFMCTNNYNCSFVNDRIVHQVEYLLPEITVIKLGVPLRICCTCEKKLQSFNEFKHSSLENSLRLEARIKKSQCNKYSSPHVSNAPITGSCDTKNEDTSGTNSIIEDISIKEEPCEETADDREYYSNIVQNIMKTEFVIINGVTCIKNNEIGPEYRTEENNVVECITKTECLTDDNVKCNEDNQIDTKYDIEDIAIPGASDQNFEEIYVKNEVMDESSMDYEDCDDKTEDKTKGNCITDNDIEDPIASKSGNTSSIPMCIHLDCITNTLSKEEKGHLFCLPKTDSLRYQWLLNLNRPDLFNVPHHVCLNRGLRVCKLHFNDNQFPTKEKNKLLFQQIPRSVLFPGPVHVENLPEPVRRENEPEEDQAIQCTSLELIQAAESVVNKLQVPSKFKNAYEKEYRNFLDWCEQNHAATLNENVLIAYFDTMGKTTKYSNLWTSYSMLRTMLRVRQNINISRFLKLDAFLKRMSEGYDPKKSKCLEYDDMVRFIDGAPDFINLAMKILLIMGYSGACNHEELSNMSTNHIQYTTSTILVSVPKTKENMARLFAITNQRWIDLIKKYANLRPSETYHKRFFINYQNGRCTVQPIAIKMMVLMPKSIATFLKLPNPERYSGHVVSSSASHLANRAGNERHGGWKC